MRRYELHKLVAILLHDFESKPHLQPLQGETFALRSSKIDDDARLDMRANGL